MKPFPVSWIIVGSVYVVGALSIVHFIRVSKPYPCERCRAQPATWETVDGREVCGACYIVCENELRDAESSRADERQSAAARF